MTERAADTGAIGVDEIEAREARPLASALKAGFRRRCPRCGEGALFEGFLKVRHACENCGQELHHHRADDFPPYLTILVAGHILTPLILMSERNFTPPLWVAYTFWPLLALALVLALMSPIKGAVVALQWAQRMHGFGDGRGPGDLVEDPNQS